jgi:hypothetical protein
VERAVIVCRLDLQGIGPFVKKMKLDVELESMV